MTKSAKTAAPHDAESATVTPFPLLNPGDLASVGARNLDFATRAARACFGGAAQLNWEIVGFMNMRFAKDVAGAQKIMTAKTSHEAYHEQARAARVAKSRLRAPTLAKSPGFKRGKGVTVAGSASCGAAAFADLVMGKPPISDAL